MVFNTLAEEVEKKFLNELISIQVITGKHR